MQNLNLPAFAHKTRQMGKRLMIFDPFRKQWVVLTPEEWVRQHFLHWLCDSWGYPRGLMAVETSLKYNQLSMRADAVVYGQQGQPLMIIECKAPHVTIDQQTLEQAARYNFAFNTRYLMLTNGLQHYCCSIDTASGSLTFLEQIPHFSQLR
ncbi:MAG: type I restriction enzyme HsdR N-terminal domain-containing protein [Bacteroidales bacterium]